MSANIFDEVDYNVYLIEQYWNKLESNSIELTESPEYDFDSYSKLSSKDALEVLDHIYQQNSYALYKEPWYNLLFKRLKKDIQKGFVSMINVQPSLFQRTMRAITPILKLFSKINMFNDVLDDTNMFYETCIGGGYNIKSNKMLIVVKYIDKMQINLNMLKTILHEYCHFYARKKHPLYIKLFEDMVSKFYKTLINEICSISKLEIDKNTKQKLFETIMKWNFYKLDNLKAKKHNFEKCVSELENINQEFANRLINLLVSRVQFNKGDAFTTSNEIIRRAYLAISDEVTATHIANFDYSYQEYYCADEIVAIMSFYKPNYKPYLQMLESLV